MSFDVNIRPNIFIHPDFEADGSHQLILDALRTIYDNSPLAQMMFDSMGENVDVSIQPGV